MSKKKYNNKSKYFKDWTTAKLKKEAISYNDSINVTECFGTKDVMALEGIKNELIKRGVEIGYRSHLVFG